MTFTSKTSPETVGQIRAMCGRGMSGRQIARDLNMPSTTVAKIIRDAMMAIPKTRSPAKQKAATVSLKHAKADYSRVKITRIPLPKAPPHIVCNASVRERYVPSELSYRGRQ